MQGRRPMRIVNASTALRRRVNSVALNSLTYFPIARLGFVVGLDTVHVQGLLFAFSFRFSFSATLTRSRCTVVSSLPTLKYS